MTPLRLCWALIAIGFATTSFVYALQLQGEYRKQEGYLWNTRRENFRLRSSVGDLSGDKTYLADRLAAAQTDLDRSNARLARLESQMSEMQLTLNEMEESRDFLAHENDRLQEDHRQMESEHKAMAEQVFKVYVAGHGARWLAGIREAGEWLATAVRSRSYAAPLGGLLPGGSADSEIDATSGLASNAVAEESQASVEPIVSPSTLASARWTGADRSNERVAAIAATSRQGGTQASSQVFRTAIARGMAFLTPRAYAFARSFEGALRMNVTGWRLLLARLGTTGELSSRRSPLD